MEQVIEKNRTIHRHYETNKNHYNLILGKFNTIKQEVFNHVKKESIERHKSRGKLLARERIQLLIDKNSNFLELSSLAAYNQYDNEFPYAGIVTGIGKINGFEAVIVANDATVKGGTYIKETIKKHIRAQEIALQNHLPCVYLVDSGGIYLPEQSKVYPDRFDFGRIFYNQATLSAKGIPQIAIVMGSCTAGGAYIPAMCDETIIVKEQGTIFIGGPPLVKAATGEDVQAEELGGAYVHTAISGVADHLAENDEHAIEICRNIFKTLKKPEKQELPLREPDEPEFDPEEIYGLIPENPKQLINGHQIILRIIDKGSLQEFKKEYAKNIITGFAAIKGYPVGLVTNNGFLTSESALKAAHFIELCNFRKIPLVFLQNITGFIVGKNYEHEGIAKHGAKLIHAVSTASVPKISIIFGGSYGAGNYAMAGRAYDPNFLFTWPNSKISVMGGEQAAYVLDSIHATKKASSFSIKFKKNGETNTKKLTDQFTQESSAYYSTSRVWDDGIIDPVNTRNILAQCIQICMNKKFEDPKTGIYRM